METAFWAAQHECQHRPRTLASQVHMTSLAVQSSCLCAAWPCAPPVSGVTAALHHGSSANIRLPCCTPTLLQLRWIRSATTLPILHISVASALWNSSPISVAEEEGGGGGGSRDSSRDSHMTPTTSKRAKTFEKPLDQKTFQRDWCINETSPISQW